MNFKIIEEISKRAWGIVDKSRIYSIIKEAIEEGQSVAEVVQEVYAVVTANVDSELTQDDVWGPHHEIRQNGEVVLNVNGLSAAAAALSGARSEPDLTEEQMEKARLHLLKHYREIEEEPPENLAGEIKAFVDLPVMGEMSAEVAQENIPMDAKTEEVVDKLIEGDENPCFVKLEIEEGPGNHGYYESGAIQAVVDQVNSDEPMGYKGHQKPEDLPYEFPDPTTHWLAAKFKKRNGKAVAIIYGLVDQAFSDLRRWIRAGRIDQVSIYGKPVYRSGTDKVIDYVLYSIDWTPRNRAGMNTNLVWASEMSKYQQKGGNEEMTLEEMLAEIRQKIAKGEMSFTEALQELGYSKEQVIEELAGEMKNKAKAAEELADVLGIDLEDVDKAKEVAGEMKSVFDENKAGEMQERIDEVIEDEVAGEQAQNLVKKMINVNDRASEEEIQGEIERVLEDESVKSVIDQIHTEEPAGVNGEQDGDKSYSGAKKKKVSV